MDSLLNQCYQNARPYAMLDTDTTFDQHVCNIQSGIPRWGNVLSCSAIKGQIFIWHGYVKLVYLSIGLVVY